MSDGRLDIVFWLVGGIAGAGALAVTLGYAGTISAAASISRTRRFNQFLKYNPNFGKALSKEEKEQAFQLIESNASEFESNSLTELINRQKRIIVALEQVNFDYKQD